MNKIRIVTKKESWENYLRKITEAHEAVKTAETEEAVNAALDSLREITKKGIQEVNLGDAVSINADIAGMINRIKLHDGVRKGLDEVVDVLKKRGEEILAEEERKERAYKLRKLFNRLAEHAAEIADIIDVCNIF